MIVVTYEIKNSKILSHPGDVLWKLSHCKWKKEKTNKKEVVKLP